MAEEKENNKEKHRIKRTREEREAERRARGRSPRGISTGSSSRSLQISGHSRSSSGRGSRGGTRPTTKSSSSRSLHTSGHSRSPSKHGLRRGIRSSEDLRAKDRARRSRPAKAKPGARAARDRDSLSPHRQRSRQRSPRANRSDDNRRAGLSSSRHGSHRSLRSEEDRLAKRQARAAGSDAAKPGAHTASNADESSLARRKNRADRPPKTNRSGEDRLAKDRARSARSHTSNPGAHTSSNGDESRSARRKIRANRDRDAKVRAKNSATKSSGNGVGSDGVVDEVERDAVGDEQAVDGAVELKAMAIEDLENEQLKEQQAQIEALKQQMQNMAQPNHGSDPDTEDDTDIDGTNEPHGQHPKKRRKCIVGILLVLLTIGGGVAGYILGNPKKKSPTKALQLDVEPTTPPTTAGGTTTAIQLPSTSPSNSPTELQIYTPPSKEDCEAIASGSTLSDQTTLTSREFVIEFDATLNSQMAEEDWVGPLKEQLQSIFLPVVAGCSTRRWLRETKSKQHRQLQLLPDFAIANGKIGNAIVAEGGCEDESAAALCHRVSVLMDLSLRDEDTKLTFVEAYLITTLRASPDNVLGLESLLSNLVVIRAAPTAPTDEPSFSPSSRPSTVQRTIQPTDVPSSQASKAPVVGPTTLEPTRSPTKAPTKAPVAAPILSTENPTASPTKAPVVAPTLAPVVGPTPPPTQVPTKGPSAVPSSAPSKVPTKVPTKRPTANPTSTPTSSPTASPTSGPTDGPTVAPTKTPTEIPTSGPTGSPTLRASQSPTVMTSVITPSATALQSSEYYCNPDLCAGDGSGQLMPGTPAGEASNAIDGNIDGNYYSGSSSHTWTQWNPYWQVQGIAGPVSTVRIWNRNGEAGADDLVGANVDLLDHNGEVLATREIQGVAHFREFEFESISGVDLLLATFWEFEFDNVSDVDTVRVLHPSLTFLIIAEVEVLGGSSHSSLITESSVASQSSSLNCDACMYVPHGSVAGPASLAIDGNRNYPGAHTQAQVDPWWQVDLQLTATVSRVVVWGREDSCCIGWLYGARIHLKDTFGNVIHTEIVSDAGVMSTFEFPPVEDVAAIQIVMGASPEYFPLNILEVEAFGVIQ